MDSLGDRMKKYEEVYNTSILGRLPLIVRVDGNNFSKWTKSVKLKKPYDIRFVDIMTNVTRDVAEDIEGCIFGYTQSDEISFILRNDQSLESTPWFSNRIQKIVSIVASMVTASFNSYALTTNLISSGFHLARFDARVFAVPTIQEAINYLIWRQNDATKNSISCACYYEVGKILGRKTIFKLMQNKTGAQQQELLFQKAGINYNNYPTSYKRGIGCYKITSVTKDNTIRSLWIDDRELPIFSKNQEFLNNILKFENEKIS